MELKPGYKQSEVGVIPEEWEVARVGDVAAVEGGYAFSSKKFVRDGKYQVVKMSNLFGGALDLQRSASFLDKIEEQEKHYVLRRDEILITLTGTTGKRDYGYSHKIGHERNLLLNQRVARLIVGEAANPSYVAFQIKMPSFMDQFFDVSKGGTGNQTNVGTRDVEAIYISLPPPPEQRAIAAALGDVDALIDALDRLIAKNRDLKQAAMQQLLTGQIRLPGFSGAWEVKRLGDVVEIKKGELITEKNAIPGNIPVIAGGKKPSYFHNRANRTGKTITISGSGANAGYVSFFETPIFASDCSTISKGPSYAIQFIYFVLHLRQEEIYSAQTGGAQPHIHPSDLRPMSIRVPQVAEQSAVAEVLSDMDAELAALEQRCDKTRSLKQGMMQELLTGRTRLV